MTQNEKATASLHEWFGKIPDRWSSQRIKTLFDMRDERNYLPLSEVNLISLYTNTGVHQHADIEHTTGNKARNADGYKIVAKNDIIVNILLCWMGAIGRSDYNGVTSPAYDIYTPKSGVNSKYYHYLFRTPLFSQQCYKVGKGIMSMRWRTYSPQFRNIIVPVPPIAEQDQIVSFLDWKISKINKLIATKRKEIKRVTELKKTVVNEAVTHGLNPDVPMKFSGVDWLENIPVHWNVARLKRIVQLSDSKISNSDLPYLGMENVDSWVGTYHLDNSIIPESICPVFHKGDILFGKLRPYLAKAIIADFDGVCSGEFLVFKNIKCNPSFLLYFLLSEVFIDNINSSTYGAKMPRTNWNYIGTQYIPIPPKTEQEQIVHFLDIYTSKINNLISKTNAVIQKLYELRDKLIYDVVTGKIDVRDIQIPDYEYVEEETETSDEAIGEEEITEEE